jgi:transposase
MECFALNQDEISVLRKEHRITKEKRAADRIKAVYLLAIGYTVAEVAEVLLVDEDTIRNYAKRYSEGGIKKLLENGHIGSRSYLDANQIKELSGHLETTTYLAVEAIVAYVKEKYCITYSENGMNQLLHRMGFVYKKAKIVPGKANAEEQKKYLEVYKNILKTKGENDPHYFLDGVHPQHNTMPAYGWVKKGTNKLIKANTGRKRININGALDAEKLEVVKRVDQAINAQSTIELFKQLEDKHPLAKNIYITLDNAGYYRSKLVTEYLNTSKIKLMFLPPYSPNLNLIERLWKFMKKKVLYNKYYEKFSSFEDAINEFFENLACYDDELQSLLTQNFQILNSS